jgi:hypothetical protein
MLSLAAAGIDFFSGDGGGGSLSRTAIFLGRCRVVVGGTTAIQFCHAPCQSDNFGLGNYGLQVMGWWNAGPTLETDYWTVLYQLCLPEVLILLVSFILHF